MKVGQVYAVLGMDLGQFNRDEQIAKNRVEGLGTSLSGILKNAFSFTLGMTFLRALRVAINSTVKSAVQFNEVIEQAEIGFTTLLGDAKKANAFIQDMAEFAAYTPFEFPDLLTASKRMMALGFAAGDVLPIMKTVGDAASALGSGQRGIEQIITGLGYIRTQGRATSRAMMLLAQAGVPSWEMIAKAVGVTTGELRDLIKKGAVPADVALTALVDGMNEKFGGLMEKMENSWKGVTTSLKDVWRMLLGSMTRDLFNQTRDWLKAVRDTMQRFRQAFQEGGLHHAVETIFGANASYALTSLTVILKGLWSVVSGVGRTIIKYWSVIGPLTLTVVKAFLSFKLAAFAVNMVNRAMGFFKKASLAMRGELLQGSGVLGLINKLMISYRYEIYKAGIAWAGTGPFTVTWLTRIKAAILGVNKALGVMVWPILLIGIVLMGGVTLWTKYTEAVQKAADAATLNKMSQQQTDYADTLSKSISGIEGEEDALTSLSKTANKNLQSFDEVHQLTDDLATSLDPNLTNMFGVPTFEEMDFNFDMEDALAQAKVEMGGFWGWFKEQFSGVGEWIKNVWSGIWGATVYIVEGVGAVIGAIVLGIVEFVSGAWTAGVLLLEGIWGALVTVWEAVWDAISYIAEGTIEVIRAIIIGAVEFVVGLWNFLVIVWETVWNSIKKVAVAAWDVITYIVEGAVEVIRAVIIGVVEFITGLWNFLVIVWDTVWDTIKTVTFTVWNVISSIVEGAVEVIRAVIIGAVEFVVGLWNTLVTVWESVWAAIKTATIPIWNWFVGLWEGVKAAWGTFADWAKGLWDGVKETWGVFLNWVQETWDKVVQKFDSLKTTLYTYIVEPFKKAWDFLDDFLKNALDWGKNLMENIKKGISAKVNVVKDAVAGVAKTIKGWLGFESPTKEGPGRYADEWAPNFIRMYAQGILDNTRLVQSAMGQVMSGLSSTSMMPTSTVPSSVFRSIAGSSFSSTGVIDEMVRALQNQAGVNARPTEIVLEVDGRRLARATLPAFLAEQDRTQIGTSVILVKT